MLPAWENHLLPPGQAASATNCYLFSGALEGWRLPKFLRTLLNSAAKFVYRIPAVTQTVADALLVSLTLPNVGDTVLVGEDTYTFASTIVLASPPYAVLIDPGGSIPATLTNLLNAITFDNGQGTNEGITYGNSTVQNNLVASPGNNNGNVANIIGSANIGGPAYSYMQVYAPDYGAAFNSTAVSENTAGARLIWLGNLSSLTPEVSTFTGGTNPVFNNAITGSSTWLEFLDPDTNVLKTQVVNDNYQRYYWASPSEPPQYNTLARIQASKPPYLLGINPPGCAPIVTVTGGGANAQLGVTFSDGNVDFIGANTIYLTPITPTGQMQLSDVTFMPFSTDPNVQFSAVVFMDADYGNTPTSPGALLAGGAGEIVQGITGGTLALSSFTNPPTLISDQTYWIGIMINTSEQIQEGDGNNASVQFVNTFNNGPPPVAPTVTPGQPNLYMYADLATSAPLEARAYVYTWISAYGEESAPSPYTLVNGWSNGTWTVGLWTPNSEDLGVNRNLAVLRLYRTVPGTSGSTVYFWVADVSLGSSDPDAQAFVQQDSTCLPPASTYVDTQTDAIIALNIQMPSTNYFPPPTNLQGLLSMPNGMVAGFTDNEIWFCEPYYMHAWPPGYTITTDFPIVGLGLTSGSVVACTAANSYVATGTAPGAMSMIKCSPPDPCLSRGSIVSSDIGVFYESLNGLIQVTNGGVSANVTELWITREKWAALTPQKNIRAIPLVSCYFAYGTVNGADTSVAQQGYNIEMNSGDAASFTIWPQPGGHRVGFNTMTAPLNQDVDNVQIDPWTGMGMIIQNGKVFYYDFQDPSPVIMPYDYMSKIYQQPSKRSYAAMRVFFTCPPGSPPVNECPNDAPADDPSWNALQPNQRAVIKVWADRADENEDGGMQLVSCREITRSGGILRIESGFKAENWQFELLGVVNVSNVQIATSVKELGNV